MNQSLTGLILQIQKYLLRLLQNDWLMSCSLKDLLKILPTLISESHDDVAAELS